MVLGGCRRRPATCNSSDRPPPVESSVVARHYWFIPPACRFMLAVFVPLVISLPLTAQTNGIDNPDCAVDAAGWAGAWGTETIVKDGTGCKVTTVNLSGSGHWHQLRNGSRIPAV